MLHIITLVYNCLHHVETVILVVFIVTTNALHYELSSKWCLLLIIHSCFFFLTANEDFSHLRRGAGTITFCVPVLYRRVLCLFLTRCCRRIFFTMPPGSHMPLCVVGSKR
ncbi:hypothetical protein, unlikely [Trypanosoma brucei brucei TREU927]|uniref:Uncharacterized protein n=1 Tax=Trypanosoma brucei brucei (strain 927/4 GUTat10.1) TaxID=185431 RepID=Q4GYK5_TRYB2|nr:hypothetical protein, unlikely [Trypanosoma brucei brucei TREU927]CAJ16579.1 hypothetical protein, unlikely [Trypanosoma brucei brucei TREU927]